MMERQVIVASKYIRLMRLGTWEYAERPHIGGIVGIVAVTPDDRLVLVEQYRVPVDARCIELPAGLAGDTEESSGEELADAARRELLEETGYAAGEMRYLTEGPPTSGMTSEVITLFLAVDARKVAEGGGDDSEDLIVHEVPLAEIDAWLKTKQREGLQLDLRIYTALYFLGRRCP